MALCRQYSVCHCNRTTGVYVNITLWICAKQRTWGLCQHYTIQCLSIFTAHYKFMFTALYRSMFTAHYRSKFTTHSRSMFIAYYRSMFLAYYIGLQHTIVFKKTFRIGLWNVAHLLNILLQVCVTQHTMGLYLTAIWLKVYLGVSSRNNIGQESCHNQSLACRN